MDNPLPSMREVIELEADRETDVGEGHFSPPAGPSSERAAQQSPRISVAWQPTTKLPMKSMIHGTPSSANDTTNYVDCLRIAHAIQTGRNWLNEIASGQVKSLDAIARRERKHVRTIPENDRKIQGMVGATGAWKPVSSAAAWEFVKMGKYRENRAFSMQNSRVAAVL